MSQEKRHIWLRCGMTIEATPEEAERIMQGDSITFDNVLTEGRYKFVGDSYIPACEVDDYNETYGTTHLSRNVEL